MFPNLATYSITIENSSLISNAELRSLVVTNLKNKPLLNFDEQILLQNIYRNLSSQVLNEIKRVMLKF